MKIFEILFVIMLVISVLLFLLLACLCFFLGLCLRDKSAAEIMDIKDKAGAVMPHKKKKPPDNKEIQAINEMMRLVNEYDGKPPVVRK